MPRQSRGSAHGRRAIAAQAARLIAEDGLTDFGQAKRKAARQLGLRESDGLPDNAEIESELRAYQALYQNEEQRDRLRDIRHAALAVMSEFAPHQPHLAGAAWNGTATRGAAIDVEVFTDDQKSLELFLINRGVAYATSERAHFFRAGQRRVPVLRFESSGYDVRLSVYSRADLRNLERSDNAGRTERGDIAEVEALLRQSEGESQVEQFLAAIR